MGDFEILKRDTLNFWRDYIVKADVTIDNVTKEMPIHSKNIDYEKGALRINVYIGSSQGEVQEVVIYNRQNEPVRIRKSALKKGEEGLLVVFLWTLKIEERITQ